MIASSEIKNRIVMQYNRNPEGWRVYTARDPRGHLDTVFLHGEDVYVLKEEVINPFKTVGVGIQEKLGVKAGPAVGPSFGLRPLDFKTLKILLTLDESEAQKGIVSEVLSQSPVPIPSIRAPAVIHGPVAHSAVPLDIMGTKQKDIDHQLREELDRLLERKYPHLKTMYG